MQRLLTLQYYFTSRPDADFQYTKFTVAIIVLLIVGGLVVHIVRKKYLKDPISKKIVRPVSGKLYLYGVLFLVLLLCRESGIPYLSMRFWWVLVALLFLYSFARFAFGFKGEYRKRSLQLNKNKVQDKYLPKKKRSK